MFYGMLPQENIEEQADGVHLHDGIRACPGDPTFRTATLLPWTSTCNLLLITVRHQKLPQVAITSVP